MGGLVGPAVGPLVERLVIGDVGNGVGEDVGSKVIIVGLCVGKDVAMLARPLGSSATNTRVGRTRSGREKSIFGFIQ